MTWTYAFINLIHTMYIHKLRSTTEPGELKWSSRGYDSIISQHPRTVKLLFFIWITILLNVMDAFFERRHVLENNSLKENWLTKLRYDVLE